MRHRSALGNIFLFLAALFTVFAGVTAAEGEGNPPEAVVAELNAGLLAAMRGGKKMGFNGRYALLKPVIEAVFDVQTITRISTGRQWQSFSADQRKALARLYTNWSAASYASNFDEENGQRFDIEKTEIIGNKAEVTGSIIQNNDESVQFHYILAPNNSGWQIVDIQIQGVSQLSMTRTQFVSILKRNGYEGLVKSLEEKIKELESGG